MNSFLAPRIRHIILVFAAIAFAVLLPVIDGRAHGMEERIAPEDSSSPAGQAVPSANTLTPAWIVRPENDTIKCLDFVLDEAGNVYVLWEGYTGSTADSWKIAKYTSMGAFLWEIPLVYQHEQLLMKDDGDLLVMGNYLATTLSREGTGMASVILDASQFGPSFTDEIVDYAVDPWGNIYGVGEHDTSNWLNHHNNLILGKWRPSGEFCWRNEINVYGWGYHIDMDRDGNVFVGGTSGAAWGDPIRPFEPLERAFVFKMDPNGQMIWNTFIGPVVYAFRGTGLSDIAVDASGSCLVSGSASSSDAWGPGFESGVGRFVAKLNPSGELQWNSFSNDTFGGYGGDLSYDTAGNIAVLVVGPYGSDWEMSVAKWKADGVFLWSCRIDQAISVQSNSKSAFDSSGGLVCLSADWVGKIADDVSLAVTSPNGGESLVAGSIHPVTWTSSGPMANVKIEFSSDNGATWMTIAASTPNTDSYSWIVPAVTSGNCLVRVSHAAAGTLMDTSDAVFFIAITSPIIGLSKTALNFGTERNGAPTQPQTVAVSNLGIGTLNWMAAASADWISVTPGSGIGAGVLTISIARTDLEPGTYAGTVTVTDPYASNSPATIAVGLNVKAEGADAPPLGAFDGPADGSVVSSSIPVTGWALDDIGVASVKIYWGTGLEDRAFIGEAVFVEGARPDVEAAYPGYPQNRRAGWGYMLLTNFLPLGDGPYTLLAYATDGKGNETLLGSKAINVDCAAAVLPFGAIDTPAQGGTASGSAYVNFGWALTPLPKSIPIDGSTITVWVDGLPLGHPVYNNYRGDIATLFPGYANSNGAVGYFNLNTTGYADGVHTIAWSVTDSAGAADGIGSRYFSIQNAAGGAPGSPASSTASGSAVDSRQQQTGIRPASELDQIPEDRQRPLYVKRGFGVDQQAEMVLPDPNGNLVIIMPAVSRIAICLEDDLLQTEQENSFQYKLGRNRGSKSNLDSSSGGVGYEAYEHVRDELRPLPIGASFDSQKGILYWQPGPVFHGEFRFVIVDKGAGTKKTITVGIDR